MELTGDILRGHTDAIILSILSEQDNYGYQINLEISRKSEVDFMLTEATLYTTFKRLESEELILSYWKDGLYVKRKYYSITEKGKAYLVEMSQQWEKTKHVIDKFIGEKKNEG